MLAYILRRVVYAIIMLWAISFAGFLIIELPPGDFLTQKLAELEARGDKSAELRVEEYRARYGLDKPLLERYTTWSSNFFTGDFGESFEFERRWGRSYLLGALPFPSASIRLSINIRQATKSLRR